MVEKYDFEFVLDKMSKVVLKALHSIINDLPNEIKEWIISDTFDVCSSGTITMEKIKMISTHPKTNECKHI